MTKTFIGGVICPEFESYALTAEEMLDRVVGYVTENSSVFRCVLKVVMVAEISVAEDREF